MKKNPTRQEAREQQCGWGCCFLSGIQVRGTCEPRLNTSEMGTSRGHFKDTRTPARGSSVCGQELALPARGMAERLAWQWSHEGVRRWERTG